MWGFESLPGHHRAFPVNPPDFPAPTRTSRRAWALLLLNRLQYSSVVLSSFAFGVFLPFIRDELELSYLQIGLLQGSWWLASAATLVPFSAIISRFDPNRVVLASLALLIPFVAAQGLAVGFWTLLTARLAAVLSHSAAAPARPLLLRRWTAPEDYAKVSAAGLSAHAALLAIAVSASPFIIIALDNWRLAYFTQGALMAAHLLGWAVLSRNRRLPPPPDSAAPDPPEERRPLTALLAYPHAWLMGIVMMCLSASWTTLVTFLPTLWEQRGIDVALGGPLLAFLYYALIPGALFGARIERTFRDRRLLLIVPAALNAVFTLAAILAGNPILAAIAITGVGLVWVFVPVIEVLPFEFECIEPRQVSVLASLSLTLSAVGFAIGPMIAGAIAQASGSLSAGALSLASLTALGVIAAAIFPRNPSGDTTNPNPR